MNYIKEFQKNNKLISDGIVGAKTLLKMKEVFGLPSIEATAHFVGQIHHETAGFKYDEENLNYSIDGLLNVFSKYFPNPEIAAEYARKPEKIANKVYANRMGNGPESSGDGWKYRGRGSLQLTGRTNYQGFSSYINNFKILIEPYKILPEHYWNVAVYFFYTNNLFPLTKTVDYNSIRKLTKRINGGYNGLQHRYDLTIKYYKILKQNEEQTNNINISNTNSTVSNSVDKENVGGQESVSSTTRDKESENSEGFVGKNIRWILSKISGGHFNSKTT